MVDLMSRKGKKIRFVLGLLIIAFGVYYGSWFGLIGIVPILFVIFNFCPLCYFKGVCKVKG